MMFALPVLVLSGCSGGPTLLPVSGTVTINNKPLADAEVVFTPDPNNQAITAGVDTTGPQGTYRAMYQGRAGLAAGKYTVTVTPKLTDAASLPAEMKDDPGMVAAGNLVHQETLKKGGMMKKGAEKAAPPQEKKSTFNADVAPGKTVFDFDVKK